MLLSTNINHVNLVGLDVVRLFKGRQTTKADGVFPPGPELTCVQYSKYMAELVYMALMNGPKTREWKELFIFFCVMPFTEYEFEGEDEKLLNPDTLYNACPSDATSNLLIGTFTELEFESKNRKIPDNRLATNLQSILKTDIFSKTYNEDQTKMLIAESFGVCFKQDYKLVKHVQSKAEASFKDIFKEYLFAPISECVRALLCINIEVEEKNTDGQTGVHTRVPHTTNDLFYSHPDIVAYSENIHNRS